MHNLRLWGRWLLLLQLLLTPYVFQIKVQWHKSCNWVLIFLNFLVNPCILWWETYIHNHYYYPLNCSHQTVQWFNLLQMYILVSNAYYHNDNYIHFHHDTIYSYFFCKGHEPLFCGELIPSNYTMTLWTQMKIFKIKMRCNNAFDQFYWLYKAWY